MSSPPTWQVTREVSDQSKQPSFSFFFAIGPAGTKETNGPACLGRNLQDSSRSLPAPEGPPPVRSLLPRQLPAHSRHKRLPRPRKLPIPASPCVHPHLFSQVPPVLVDRPKSGARTNRKPADIFYLHCSISHTISTEERVEGFAVRLARLRPSRTGRA